MLCMSTKNDTVNLYSTSQKTITKEKISLMLIVFISLLFLAAFGKVSVCFMAPPRKGDD